ncbi:MAG: CRISPR-associated helicase Cas3' [Anaerolineae bacterium]|nr:CRISPR-associated helicase Cas3' [Anaerolineae bacterium]
MSEQAYHYQAEVLEYIQQGHNLMIQAPTGAGKTRAALNPGLLGIRDHPNDFPPRILYGVPMRVLARSFIEEYGKTAREKHWPPELYPTIQTGEQPDDPLFEGRVIFATVDQMLASFLNIPYGLPTRLDNINAGALIGAYLVFDEFHLYPQSEMMLTVLAMLKMLQGISRFIMMSATFSPVFLNEIARVLGAEVIADEPGIRLDLGRFADIARLRTRERTFYAADGALTPQAVLDRIGDANRAICICNTVDRAQALYRGLRDTPGVECRLLHSRFYRQDRREIENWALERFKQRDGSKAILVATQVIEVGLDISSEVMLTECAPAASLIQRAGRCARNVGETGQVHVFQPYDEEGQVNYAPYIDKEEGKEAICHKTWNALASPEFNGQVMGFSEEQQLVKIAHSEADAEFASGLGQRIDGRIEEITRCMSDRDPGWPDALIRKQSTVPMYIHEAPNQDDLLTTKPWRREPFSLSKGQLARLMEQPDESEADFTLQSGTERTLDVLDAPGMRFVTEWQPLREAGDVYRSWQFAAHPLAVSYTPETGLELRPGLIPAPPSPEVKERPWDRLAYRAERYHEHIAGLWWAYTIPLQEEKRFLLPLRTELIYPLHRLCEKYGLDAESGERIMRLALALHDVGKLNEPWQAWCRAWQLCYAQSDYPPTLPINDPYPLAHTDYDSGDPNQRELQRVFKHPPRGNHAVEGAEACVPLIREAIPDDECWQWVALGAMMRHHTPDAKDCGEFHLIPGAYPTIHRAMRLCQLDGMQAYLVQESFKRSGCDVTDAADSIKPSRNEFSLALVYLLFARILRLADQRSGRYLARYDQDIRHYLDSLESEVQA